MEESNSSQTTNTIKLLPPLKQSENQLTITNNEPVYLANHINHEKQLYEISLNKFDVLTNQPTTIENCKLSSFSSSSFKNAKSMPRATPLMCKWNTKEMPKLKIVKVKNKSAKFETPNERRMRLQFEQMGILRQKNEEIASRNLMSRQYASSSMHAFDSKSYNAGLHDDKNLWGSTAYKDINLGNQIIDQFYSLDHRQMRYFRDKRPDYYKLTRNKHLDSLKGTLLGADEK